MMLIPFVFIISIARRDGMDTICLENLQNTREVGEIILLSRFCPVHPHTNAKTKCVPLRFNVYKTALESLHDNHVPTGYLERSSSLYAGFDEVQRTRWRAMLVLDFVQEMRQAQKYVPQGELFMHLENDVKLLPEFMPDLESVQKPFSCYYPYGAYQTAHAYGGGGALCFVFRNDQSVDKAIQCALSRHLLQPLDWIIFDCFPEMKAYRASVHMGRISTRI